MTRALSIPAIYAIGATLLTWSALGVPTSLAAQGADRAAFARAAAYSEEERGYGIVVMVDGRVVFEQYARNVSPARTNLLASGTKSFVGPLAIAAQADGLLRLDEPVSETLHEWRADPRRAGITIRQLLTLTSGIEGAVNLEPPSYAESVTAQVTAEAGTRFQYGAAPFQIFGEVLRRKLEPRGETVAQYLKRRLLDPVGIQTGFWRGMGQGQPQLPSGAYMNAREWVKFGEFIRRGGEWNGTQVLPRDEVEAMFRGTDANPAYGLTWWLNVDITPELRAEVRQLQNNFGAMDRVPGLEGMVTAAGAFKQRLYIIPSRRMVVARLGNSVGPQFDDARFLGLLTGTIRE